MMHRKSSQQLRALSAYVKLMRCAQSVTQRVHSHLKKHGLTVSQFGVLEALLHLGPQPQGEIGKKILKTSGNMTMVIDNLEQRGLVRREAMPGDRRSYRILLSGEGQRLVREIFPAHAGIIAREMSVLTADEQRELARLCKKLGRRPD